MSALTERFLSCLDHAPVVAHVKTETTAQALRVASACVTAGFQILAIDSLVPGATDVIAALAARADTVVGLWGPVTTSELDALQAGGGAFYLWDPVEAVLPPSELLGIPWVTSREDAERLDILSRGAMLCVRHVEGDEGMARWADIQDAVPGSTLLASGKIGGDEVGRLVAAGARGVCLSSALYSEALLRSQDYRAVRDYAAAVHREAAQLARRRSGGVP